MKSPPLCDECREKPALIECERDGRKARWCAGCTLRLLDASGLERPSTVVDAERTEARPGGVLGADAARR